MLLCVYLFLFSYLCLCLSVSVCVYTVPFCVLFLGIDLSISSSVPPLHTPFTYCVLNTTHYTLPRYLTPKTRLPLNAVQSYHTPCRDKEKQSRIYDTNTVESDMDSDVAATNLQRIGESCHLMACCDMLWHAVTCYGML